jgi:hypothetical protein
LSSHSQVGRVVEVLIAEAFEEGDGLGQLDRFRNVEEIEITMSEFAADLFEHTEHDCFCILIFEYIEMYTTFLIYID